ncbi:Thioredoxin [Haloplanus vescus]|uniref:Thioredoxin n=1 Tax=Haloplanus vescus TaxID=555874 RepID=A0A1H3WFW2_9EURY|nr:thioredoxin family protein [Haloplanus vescus]SDZ85840.1 Thioredoxin [Haloplanus vescus]
MAGPSTAALEDALDDLIDAGLVAERDDGSLVTTDTFESARRVYRDSYADIDDATFRTTVAEAFGVDESTAAERIDAGSVTRADLIAYLSLDSTLDGVDDERLATMATLVAELSPGSPVPQSLTEVDDDSWRNFLDEHPDAVVTVWRHDCAPCAGLKEDLDDILSTLPDGVAVAGIDGESAPTFRRATDVDSAPAVCCFRDGNLETVVTGRRSPATYREEFDALY